MRLIAAYIVLGIIGVKLSPAATTQPATLPTTFPTTAPTALFDAGKLTINSTMRADVVNALTLYVRNVMDMSHPNSFADAQKFLSVALLLDPHNKPAYVANVQIKQSQLPSRIANQNIDAAQTARTLLNVATRMSGSKNADDRILAAYIYALILKVQPGNETAIYQLGQLKDSGIQLSPHGSGGQSFGLFGLLTRQ